MTLNEQNLTRLFAGSREAVAGLKDNKIFFANAAAENRLGLRIGMDAAEIAEDLPEALAEGSESVYLARRSLRICASRLGDVLLLHLYPEEPAGGDMSLQQKTVRSFADSLMTLRMGLDILLKRRNETDEDESICSYRATVYREYFRLQRLCSHLSIVSNLAQGTLPCQLATLDLGEMVYSLVDSVRALCPETKIEYAQSPEEYILQADSSLLEIALLNLLSNSLLRCREGGLIRVSLRRSGRRIMLSVDDNGSGIKPEMLPHLFDSSAPVDFTDSEAGVGLGLRVAQGILEAHGGTLLLESRPDCGCRCRISLPAQTSGDIYLHQPAGMPEIRSMNTLLTELSVVLPRELYNEKLFD